jgi:D-aminopeptidase
LADQSRIRAAAERAVSTPNEVRFRLEGPLIVELGCKFPLMPEMMAYLPLFERTGSHDMRFEAAGPAEVAHYLQFLLMVLPALLP